MIDEQTLFRRRRLVVVTALLCCFIWGVSYPLLKTAYRLLDIDASDFVSMSLFAGVRFTTAGALTLLYAAFRRRRHCELPSGKRILGIVLLSLFQTVLQYLCIFIGLANSQSSKGSILNQIGAFLLVLLAPVFYHDEQLTVNKILGCLMGFGGIALVNVTGRWDWSISIWGEGFIVFSSLSAAAGYLISKQMSQRGDAVVITGSQQLLGGLVLIVPGIVGGGELLIDSALSVALVAFLSVSVALVYILWTLLLKYNEISKIAVYKFGVPIIGVLSSGILLNENVFTGTGFMAMLLVSLGIITVNTRWKLRSIVR